ncbi:MAG TPA: AbrB/MazE/SpoVT family DNA-binding domain-containing protein [Candidatus Limnocylindrales bacterium]|nr:AbrB/MazE/SpoVT family DNA-binding domain-containing protein [Candidatus Limnocylindrales bacterium]
MSLATVTRHSQVTIPKGIREAVGITEGDKVRITVVEGNKIIIEKAREDAWKDCTNFLPEDFEKILKSMHADSTARFKRLRLVP